MVQNTVNLLPKEKHILMDVSQMNTLYEKIHDPQDEQAT